MKLDFAVFYTKAPFFRVKNLRCALKSVSLLKKLSIENSYSIRYINYEYYLYRQVVSKIQNFVMRNLVYIHSALNYMLLVRYIVPIYIWSSLLLLLWLVKVGWKGGV